MLINCCSQSSGFINREDIPYNRLIASKNKPNWSDSLEIIALELELINSKKCLVCVCYRPPSCNLDEWLHLFTAFLDETSHYDKVLISGDFNFPDLTELKLCACYFRKNYFCWVF
jgi:hypothetical protein